MGTDNWADIKLAGITLREYIERVNSFHGYTAPGMILGGFMVDLALSHLPMAVEFDAISETSKCLPDAIQLLTPCTIGNGWLRILDLGRFALTLYEKKTPEGIRVFVDPARLGPWPLVRDWFMKIGPKEKRDLKELVAALCEVSPRLLGVQRVRLKEEFMKRKRHRDFAICPQCMESYPEDDGKVCLGCQGKAPYAETGSVR